MTVIDHIVQDLRYAARGLRQNPGFTATVTLILALGIGANTAVFSIVNSLVLKTLPVQKSEELVMLARPAFSYPIVEQVRDRGRDIFSSLFAWSIEDLTIDWGGDPATAQTLVASDEFYSTLGVTAAYGRTFSGEDDVAVISHEAWTRHFKGDRGVLGRVIRVGRLSVAIIGVTPEGFYGVAPGMTPEVTVPLRSYPKIKPDASGKFQQPMSSWLHVMARLKPGITLIQANSALQTFWPQVLEAVTDPKMPPDRRARFLARTTSLESASSGFSRVRNGVFGPLVILSALVGLLLLVGCATVGNLLLARAGGRRQEIAVRFAVGASRLRIISQLFTEGLFLASLGGVSGLLVATWGSTGLIALLSTTDDPIQLHSTVDGGVLVFTTMLCVLTAIVFTLAPALRAAHMNVAPALKEDSRILRKGRLGSGLVVAQVTLSMILVVGAALFMRSLSLILSEDAGFERKDLLILTTDPSSSGYQGGRLLSFYEQLLERLRAHPGVATASLSVYPPISGADGAWTESIGIDGAAPQQTADTRTFFNPVSAGFFQTLGVRLLRGRDFGPQDNAGGTRTVIVNEAFARAYFPNVDPIGRHVSVGLDPSRQNLEIVGIVQDAKYRVLQEPKSRIAYQPWLQLNGPQNFVIELRASAKIGADLRAEVRNMDASIPVTLETAEDRIRESLVPQRVLAILSSTLGSIALLLASVGLYGLMAYRVSRRSNEIALRMAVGASNRDILTLVLRESLVVAGFGVVLGLGASIALGRMLKAALYGITSTDSVALLLSVLIMTMMALLAGYLPALRASRVDPAAALRQQ